MISFKDISIYLMISIIINLFSYLLESTILKTYLISNITTILLTLMAINTATSGLIISKLQEIKIKFRTAEIKPIIKSLTFSLKEQISLIAVSTILIIIIDSKITTYSNYSLFIDFFLETLLIFIFIYAIDILWDTGKAVFIIVDIIDDL